MTEYDPQLLPSTEVARFCTYRHTSPVEGTYYGRTHGFKFTIEELNHNRWHDGLGYLNSTLMTHALQKYPDWNSWKHEVCRTHLFDWECTFVECCGVLESKATGHSYNVAVPEVGSRGYYGCTAWNKGLTRDDPRVNAYASKLDGRPRPTELFKHIVNTRRQRGDYDNMAWNSEQANAKLAQTMKEKFTIWYVNEQGPFRMLTDFPNDVCPYSGEAIRGQWRNKGKPNDFVFRPRNSDTLYTFHRD